MFSRKVLVLLVRLPPFISPPFGTVVPLFSTEDTLTARTSTFFYVPSESKEVYSSSLRTTPSRVRKPGLRL